MHPLVSAETLATHLDDPAWVVFDTRHDLAAPESGEDSYRREHIPGARFAHLDRDLSGAKVAGQGRHPLPEPATFADFLVRSGVGRRGVIVAYDAGNGLYASRLWWLARSVGHADVVVLDGGLAAWKRAGLPTTADLPHPARGDFVAGDPLTATFATDDVAANLATQARLIVDARAPERYRGDVEPFDPVAGHIPGALNHPMAKSVEADGRFKPPATLRADLDALLAGRPATEVVQSCGSGVTGCHNLLAMELAGLSGAALYAGSWSAWCSDPTRPVARGG